MIMIIIVVNIFFLWTHFLSRIQLETHVNLTIVNEIYIIFKFIAVQYIIQIFFLMKDRK